MACCSSGNDLPLEILEKHFKETAEAAEAAEAAKDSEFVNISETVVTMHPRHHDTLRNLLMRKDESAAGKLRVSNLLST